jgi:hypothetical protein
MSVVPDSRLGKIQFYEARLAPWTANAAAIGLTPGSVANLADLTTDARAAYNAAEAARAASRAATQNFHDKVRAMHSGPGAGQDMIEQIRLHAESKDDPNVYVLAQIPPPAKPGTLPPPGTPFDFRVALLQNGAIELKWKANNPSGSTGTIYEVSRQLSGGSMTLIGASGTRSFIDASIPSGASPVTYRITGVRSTVRGNPAQFIVTFGVGGPGVTVTSVTEDAPVKLAA